MSKKTFFATMRKWRPLALLAALPLIPCLATAQDANPEAAKPPTEAQDLETPPAIAPDTDSDGDLIPDIRDPQPLIANVPIYWSLQKFALSRPAPNPIDTTWASAPSLDIASVLPAPQVQSLLTVMPLTSLKPAKPLTRHPYAPLALFGNDTIRLGALEKARAAAFLRGWRADGANMPIQLVFTVRFLNFDSQKWEMKPLEVPITLGGKRWATAKVVPKKPGDDGLVLLVGDKVVKQDFVAEIDASSAKSFLTLLASSEFSPAFDFADASGLDPAATPDNPPEPGEYSLSAAFKSILHKTRQIRIEGPGGLVWTWRAAPVDLASGRAVTFGVWSAYMNKSSEDVYGAPLFAFDGAYPISIAGWDNGFQASYWSFHRKGREADPGDLASSRLNADVLLTLSSTPPSALPPEGATPIASHLRGVWLHNHGLEDKADECFAAARAANAPQGYSWCGSLKAQKPEDPVPAGAKKDEALERLTLAAWQGSLPAMSALGDLLLQSGSLEGRDWLELAATENDAKAAARLARFLRDGELGTAPDPAAAAKWLQRAADAGDAPSLLSLGEALRAGAGVRRNPKKAAEYFRRAGEAGNSEGLTWYALCLLEGNGVRRDVPKAIDLLGRAADAGNANAKFFHGVCLFSGYGGTPPDKPAAMVRFMSAAAEQPAANVFLGVGYLNGLGVAKNEKKAVECFKAAAERKCNVALLWLAHCHANGIGVKKDVEEARNWARKAVEAGIPAGREMLLTIQE